MALRDKQPVIHEKTGICEMKSVGLDVVTREH